MTTRQIYYRARRDFRANASVLTAGGDFRPCEPSDWPAWEYGAQLAEAVESAYDDICQFVDNPEPPSRVYCLKRAIPRGNTQMTVLTRFADRYVETNYIGTHRRIVRFPRRDA